MANTIKTISPFDGTKLGEFELYNSEQIQSVLETASKAQYSLANDTLLEGRKNLIQNLANNLTHHRSKLAEIITKEMGKPLSESISEIEKCILTCNYYIANIDNILAPKKVEYADGFGLITYEPIGVIFAVMPWNFPFWQLLRHAIPQLLLGNTIVFKHSSQVPECANAIEKLFLDSGFEDGSCIQLRINSTQTEEVISSKYIQAVTLTGSEGAGRSVASLAGKYLKKCVMELGGSDPFIVFDDVDVKEIAKKAAGARLRNAGQACTSAKRFIVHENIYQNFIQELKELFESMEIGPLSSSNSLNDVAILVNDAKSRGANIITGGDKLDSEGFYYKPTIIDQITPEMKLFHEEAFGPIASIYKFQTIDESVDIANSTRFGLSSSIWTKNEDVAIQISERLLTGNVFINAVSSSRPELPFGGVKNSGFGRELAEYGVYEFANIKSIFVKR